METLNKKLQSLSIIIADDDETTLKWLVRVLSIYFKDVRGAKNSMEALELFMQNETDVVISDIQMPEVDGLNLLQKISYISPRTLKIVMTAFNSHEYLNRSVEADINFYLKKPIDIDELLVAIASNISAEEHFKQHSLGENYIYSFDKKIVIKDNEIIKLTKKEVLFIELLLKHKHSIISIEQIENSVWEEPTTVDAIRMVVVGMRKKIYPSFIENVKGLGYKLNI